MLEKLHQAGVGVHPQMGSVHAIGENVEIIRQIDVNFETPTSASLPGAKGVGESGTGAAPAVVMNAVNDALRPFGARVTTQPITPLVILTELAKI